MAEVFKGKRQKRWVFGNSADKVVPATIIHSAVAETKVHQSHIFRQSINECFKLSIAISTVKIKSFEVSIASKRIDILVEPSYDLTGCRILDLGCGAGRDVYLVSQLVGEKGSVVGIGMTDEQLEVAREFQSYHAEKFGFANMEFYSGFEMAELEPASFDVIISNCVINLFTDKHAVLKACRDLLKPGGELYFSDIYASRRVPESLRKNKVLWGECLSGALYRNDFENLAIRVGFPDPRLVEDSPISTIQNKAVANLVQEEGQAGLEFYSVTYCLFGMNEILLEPACKDYGQAVIYKGSVPRAASFWKLDKGHVFEAGKVRTVCGNTYNMLAHNPRLKEHFEFIGDFSKHYGLFGGGLPYDRPVQGGIGKGGKPASCC
jgi:arsenite methyltransferase